MESFYQVQVKTLHGKDINLEDFRGKWVLVVNTASQCGFTPQFAGLEALYRKYIDHGLVIIGFPCNQFGNQEPGDAKSISKGCLLNYGVTFPMGEKLDVNGDDAHPLFLFLRKSLPGWFGDRIYWSFTKSLIDPQGKPVKRFAPFTKPEKVDEYLKKKGL